MYDLTAPDEVTLKINEILFRSSDERKTMDYKFVTSEREVEANPPITLPDTVHSGR